MAWKCGQQHMNVVVNMRILHVFSPSWFVHRPSRAETIRGAMHRVQVLSTIAFFLSLQRDTTNNCLMYCYATIAFVNSKHFFFFSIWYLKILFLSRKKTLISKKKKDFCSGSLKCRKSCDLTWNKCSAHFPFEPFFMLVWFMKLQ